MTNEQVALIVAGLINTDKYGRETTINDADYYLEWLDGKGKEYDFEAIWNYWRSRRKSHENSRG